MTVEILWSITRGACLTAAVIVLIRLLFRRVLSAKAKYYLWLLLALRLMLPALPESPVSLLNVLPDFQSENTPITSTVDKKRRICHPHQYS